LETPGPNKSGVIFAAYIQFYENDSILWSPGFVHLHVRPGTKCFECQNCHGPWGSHGGQNVHRRGRLVSEIAKLEPAAAHDGPLLDATITVIESARAALDNIK